MYRPRALLEGHGHALALRIEDRIQKMDGQAPPEGGEVQVVPRADWEVQLRLEGVQDQVYLIHQQSAGLEELQHRRAVGRAPLQLLVPGAQGVLNDVQVLHKLEEDALDGHGARHDDAPRADGVRQLPNGGRIGLGPTVEGESEDALPHYRREQATQDGARELQQSVRDDLHDEAVAIGQHEGEQGGHDGGLARSHDHLLHQGPVIVHGMHELLHHCHLRLSQNDIPCELKDEEARVKGQRRVHKVPL
mmetsp:Transcript_27413/g.49364  ORF Transcript_27413/g.49364 Transcript_27413/m.49364 type:complete len:248 (+) Transcript_27413:969-1712(+)